MKEKLWFVYRTNKVGYDEYESIVAIAETEQQAKNLFPYPSCYGYGDFSENPHLVAELLGVPTKEVKNKYLRERVICSSYRAG